MRETDREAVVAELRNYPLPYRMRFADPRLGRRS